MTVHNKKYIFSGHESFPCKTLWLKKGYDFVVQGKDFNNPNSVIDSITKGIPMGRMGTIEELGELAAFLASQESSYITGQGIVLDGASTLPETMVVGS